MLPTKEEISRLENFVRQTDFGKGLLALDLDGTALLEDRGKVFISSSVEKAVKAVHDLGRPVLINTLRFPLSVIHTVGDAWYQLTDVPILTILLNGSVLGYIKKSERGLIYEEIAAFPMTKEEVGKLADGIRELTSAGIEDILLFYYTRDWSAGETLWTPNPARIEGLKAKYVSASRVVAGPVEELAENLQGVDVLMAALQVDRPEDTLMAYQHSKRSNFFSHAGVDKATGLCEMAKRLSISLDDSIGAGDTEMDSFLSEVGLAIVVGDAVLPYRGKKDTIRVGDPLHLGELICAFIGMMPNGQNS